MLKRVFLGAFFSCLIWDVGAQTQSAFTRLADGFDFPVGKPDGRGYYKARGFRANRHVGEDWDGLGGGNTDLRDPVFSIADGVVVYARDVHLGWGNVIIVRHAFRDSGAVKNVDALYGHLNQIFVRRGQNVIRGQRIATIGTAHGVYHAHLHFEMRKNIAIGMNRAVFRRDFSNYYDPSKFVLSHRRLQTARRSYAIAMNTFKHDAKYNVEGLRNFRPRSQSTTQSSVALKRALAAKR